MPFIFTIDTQLGAILIEGKGLIDDENMELTLRGVRTDRQFSDNLRLFADLSGVTESRLSTEGMDRFARQIPFMNSTRRAILVSGQAAFGMFRSYQAYCALHNKPAPQVFMDRKSAIDFLNQKLPASKHLPMSVTPLKPKPSCAWCKAELPAGDIEKTHFHVSGGLCLNCLMKFSAASPAEANRFLETKNEPLLLVDGDIRVLSANSSFGALVGKPAGSIEHLSTGEVFDCEQVSPQATCKKSESCLQCALRRLVTDCLAGKEDSGEAYLHRKASKGVEELRLRFTTERVRYLALVRIDRYETVPMQA